MNFNFDEWADLYKKDPAEFERRRKEVLEAEILKSPVSRRHKLRLLQVQCDSYRNTLSPIDATVQMSTLLMKTAHKLKHQLYSLKVILSEK